MQWKVVGVSALLSLISAVQALSLDTPLGTITTGEPLYVDFQSTPEDPVFDLRLSNTPLEKSFPVAYNVTPSAGTVRIDITVPCVGADL